MRGGRLLRKQDLGDPRKRCTRGESGRVGSGETGRRQRGRSVRTTSRPVSTDATASPLAPPGHTTGRVEVGGDVGGTSPTPRRPIVTPSQSRRARLPPCPTPMSDLRSCDYVRSTGVRCKVHRRPPRPVCVASKSDVRSKPYTTVLVPNRLCPEGHGRTPGVSSTLRSHDQVEYPDRITRRQFSVGSTSSG